MGEKYYMQTCQDDKLNYKFRKFHNFLVNQVVNFCKGNNIDIDEFRLSADGLKASIDYGKWHPGTDSAFTLLKNKDKGENEVFMYSI